MDVVFATQVALKSSNRPTQSSDNEKAPVTIRPARHGLASEAALHRPPHFPLLPGSDHLIVLPHSRDLGCRIPVQSPTVGNQIATAAGLDHANSLEDHLVISA